MAQDAELKLKVSLDLGFFRQQLAGLGQAAAGYNIPVQVKFDRRSVQNELNALSSNIRRRTYFLEVKTNLKSEIDNAATLAKALTELERLGQKTKGAANRAVTGVGTGTSAVDAAKFQSMVNRATKPALESLYAQMAKAKIPMGDVGKGTVAELRAAIISGVPRITQDIAQGLANGLDPKLKENGSKGAKLFIDAFKDASGIASPSKVFKQIGEFSADGLEIGFINGLKDFKNKAVAEIKKIAALMKLELASVGDVRIGAGIGAIRGGVRGGTQYGAPIGPLQTGSREPWGRGTRGMYGGGGFEPYMAGAGRQLPAAFTRIPGISPTTSTANMLGVGLPALPAAGMSSAAGMRQAELFAREAAARARSAERGLAVMQENAIASRVSGQVPLGGGGPFLPPGGPPSSPTGGGGGLGGFGQFGRAMGGVSLPGAGTIRELGTEFSFAAKQVLLFGTAYKALAFIQDFPGQVGQAVGQLQSFRNTLQSVTGNAEMAGQANEFILAAVERYNIPLQSARDGFVKLFASMEPAGFAAGEIQNLFLGITKAAATYGMSADKVDRVNYAFAQMASKGQVMSEELKGQLGDVLPGAMGIFAEAAGFKGPDAIQKFNKALEDGVYKGGEMRKLLKNVADGMNKEFGPGAEGAAKTFQGSMNRMQNALKSFYESFEPAAISVVNQVAVPLVGTLKNITEGVNAYFKGQAAANPEAQKFADTLQVLIPAISGIAQNVKVVLGGLSTLGGLFANVALQVSRLLALPIIGYLASAYAQVLILSTAFTFLANSAIGTAIAALVRFIAQGIIYAQVTLGMRVATQQTTVAMYQFGTAVQTTMIKSVIGIAIVAISAFIAKIMELRGQLAAISGDAKSMEDMAKASAKLGDVGGTKEAVGNIKERLNTYKQLKKEIASAKKIESGSTFSDRGAISSGIEVSNTLAKKLVELGVISANSLSKTAGGYKILEGNLGEIKTKIDENISSFEKAGQKGNDYINKAIAANQKLKQQSSMQGGVAAEDGRQRKVPLNEMLDLESQRRFKMKEADDMEKLNQKIREARKQGNEYEAERLESTRESLRLENETAALKDYINLLIDKEAELIGGKVLSQKAFDNKLEDAKIQLYVRQKDLKEALAKVGDKEREQQKKIREEQERFASTLIDIKFENGFISTQEYNRLKIDQEIAKILKEFPNLTKQQKDEIAGVIRNKQTQLRIVREEIALLRATNDIERRRIELQREGYSEAKIKEIISLEKVRDNLKQVRELVDSFVTDTSSDYKGFLKAVISGEDAVDALEQFQEGLKDRVLTIFLDFTMKPMEDILKNAFNKIFTDALVPKTALEAGAATKPSTSPVEATDKNTASTDANTRALDELTNSLNTAGGGGDEQSTSMVANIVKGIGPGGLMNPSSINTGYLSGGYGSGQISDIFAAAGINLESFTQSSQSFAAATESASMSFQDISQSSFSYSESLNQNADNINNATKNAAEGGASFVETLGGVVQGIGMVATSAMTIVAGIEQMQKGGTKNTLAGIGSILMGVGGGILGFGKLFGANGGVARGGWKPFPVTPFANGGTVSGPTLGLVGEGKYNEAIVPLPDGRSIPVALQEGPRSRDLISGKSERNMSPVLNMSFQTTSINGVEYVSKDQLEQAMAQTRRLAAKEGATKGATMALDKLQQSPSVRRRVGM